VTAYCRPAVVNTVMVNEWTMLLRKRVKQSRSNMQSRANQKAVATTSFGLNTKHGRQDVERDLPSVSGKDVLEYHRIRGI